MSFQLTAGLQLPILNEYGVAPSEVAGQSGKCFQTNCFPNFVISAYLVRYRVWPLRTPVTLEPNCEYRLIDLLDLRADIF